MRSLNNSIWSLTNITILITIVCYFLAQSIPQSNVFFGLNLNFYYASLWHQPISTLFMHGGNMHLFMNMFVLFQFGNMIEASRGKLFFFLLYFLGGILTSLATFFYLVEFAPTHNVIGASGAISFILGYIAYVDRFNRNGIILWIILISFAPLLIGENVAWYAHLIGLVLGFISGIFLKPKYRRRA